MQYICMCEYILDLRGREKVKRCRRYLHNEECHHHMVKWRRIVRIQEIRNGKHTRRWEDNTKMNPKEILCGLD
jgi:hypothetical protein